MRTVWLAGASGLVGGHLLARLLGDAEVEQVVSVGRRAVPVESPKLTQVTLDFSAAAAFDGLPAPDAALCALGTTLKRAGSREAFRAVDHDAVLAFARAARAAGARSFVHVSALGADERSRIFYNRVKGETEAAVTALAFPSAWAVRPSILDGARAEPRPAERIGLAIGRALAPLLGRYRPTRAADVAAAMVRLAREARPGTHALEAEAIPAAARG